MQLIYFTIFMITMIAYAILGLPRQEEQFELDKDTVAIHMTAWHKSAIKRCSDAAATPCATGVINPTSYLYPSMRNGNAFGVSRFTTRYDATAKMLVTTVNPVVANSGISNEVMFSALNKMVDGESSMIGVFNKTARRIDFDSLTGIYQKASVDVSTNLTTGFTTGSPVILTNM
jgi:hypothetical protein|nr:hypothetical protein [Neorhizobium tomejilense]